MLLRLPVAPFCEVWGVRFSGCATVYNPLHGKSGRNSSVQAKQFASALGHDIEMKDLVFVLFPLCPTQTGVKLTTMTARHNPLHSLRWSTLSDQSRSLEIFSVAARRTGLLILPAAISEQGYAVCNSAAPNTVSWPKLYFCSWELPRNLKRKSNTIYPTNANED